MGISFHSVTGFFFQSLDATVLSLIFFSFQELIIFGVLTTTASLGATGTDVENTGWNRSTQQKRGWRASTASCSAKTPFCGELPCSTTRCIRPARCPSVSSSRTWGNLSRTPTLGGITVYEPREGGLTHHSQVGSLFGLLYFFVPWGGFQNVRRAPSSRHTGKPLQKGERGRCAFWNEAAELLLLKTRLKKCSSMRLSKRVSNGFFLL